MKKWFFILSIAASVAVLLAQTRTPINIGTVADDKSGDPARNAFIKINNNESNIFRLLLTNSTFVARTSALSSLSSLSGSAYPIVFVQGTFGGLFRWHSASSQSTNAYTVIAAPYGAATGRYIRESDANAAPIVVNELQTLADGDAFGDYRLAYVTSDTIGAEGSIGLYYYDPYSTASDDGVEVVLPSGAIAEGRGRWIRLALDNMVGSTANTTPSKLVGLDANRKAKTLDVGVTDIASKVDSIAALVALDPTDRKLVQTLGYYAPGDGGGGVYRWTNALPANTATNFGMWFAGSTGYWNLVREGGVYNVRQFGAKGDSKANNITVYTLGNDDTARIQQAIDMAIIDGGGTVYIPQGTYYVTDEILIQRRDDTFSRLGLTNTDADSTYWNDRPRVSVVGDGNGTLMVAVGDHGIFYVAGKAAYSGYSNRIQNVVLEDINFHHMANSVNANVVSIYNAGYIALNRLRSRGGFISLKLSALSETQVNKCDFLNSQYGVWMERGNGGSDAGDMAGVTLVDCQVMSQARACLVAHYFRDIHVIGGFYGSREVTVAAIWLSGLSPTANDGFWLQDVGLETDPSDTPPAILIGADGSEGVYSAGVYPFNTWTNSQVSMRGLNVDDCTMSVTSTQGAIRLRGANTVMTKGLVVNGSRFDTASTAKLIVVEDDVPTSVVLRYGAGNVPVDLLARTADDRPAFLTTTVEANVGNLLNAGWRDMSKAGNNWFGAEAPVTVITNLVGPFGVELAGGQQRVTRVPIWAGASPVRLTTNDVFYMDWAVLWNTTNTASISTAVRGYDSAADTYHVASAIGSQVEYGTYTNSWGVWKRYVAAMRPTAGVTIDNIAFNNFADTNTTVTLGYLALYADAYSGDMSSLSPSGASVWAGRYYQGDLQWTQNPTQGNWFARKWTAGWAVRGAFSASATYSKGTCITSSTNVYLATQTVSSGGAAPTHTSGITNGWAFVATGSAATEQRLVAANSSGLVTVSNLDGEAPTVTTVSESAGTTTLTVGGKTTYSHYWSAAADGNTTLAWSGLVDGDNGTIYVHPAATNVTVTLPNYAYSPTGGTLTVNGGTGSTNHTIIAWENKVVGGTNRVSANASNYYQ